MTDDDAVLGICNVNPEACVKTPHVETDWCQQWRPVEPAHITSFTQVKEES